MKLINLLLLGILVCSLGSSCKVTQKKKQKYITHFYHELKDSFPEAEVTLLEDSIKVIFPDNVMFDVGSAVWKSTFLEKLIRFAGIANKYERTNLLITGHTDDTGESTDNDRLSKFRAENVKSKLAEHSVSKERLFAWGMGSRHPIDKNNTEQGKARNRRVEFIVLYHAQAH